MEIKQYKTSRLSYLNLIDLVKTKYQHYANYDYFISDYHKSYSYCTNSDNVTFMPFAVYTDGKIQAHIALIIDKRLPDGEAFFGFFDCASDIKPADALWDDLVKTARGLGITTLKGPINGSIWHQYRCIKQSDESQLTKTEPFADIKYYDFFKSKNPSLEISYYSAKSDNFDYVLQLGMQAYDSLGQSGFSISEMKHGSTKQLQEVASISKIVFGQNWGYTGLTPKEFLDLYSTQKLKNSKTYLLYKDDKIIGFCGVYYENDNTLVCKTIALLPEYQGVGLGNMMVYKVHLDARHDNIKNIIYSQIRDNNSVSNFPKGSTVIFRRYAAFEYCL